MMRKRAIVFGISFLLAFATAASAQSLADLARKERERRQEIKEEKIISPEEVAKFTSEQPEPSPSPDQIPAASESKPPEAQESAQVKSEEAEKKDPDEPVDFQGRPESYWRKTMSEARQKVADLEREANVITMRISGLQTKFYNEDNGFQQQNIQREISKSFYEQDKNKEELAKAKRALDDLENEARKSGALPGWIR